MNVVSRGTRNALRSPVRSGAIVLMLAISIGLILVMLAARSSVTERISTVKAATATTISVAPAGIQGGMGGGTPLTSTQIATIASTTNVTSVVSTLTDQMGTSDTNLTPSTELGSFGARQQRFEGTESSTPPADMPTETSSSTTSNTTTTARTPPVARTTVTGTTNVNSISTDGGSLDITSGSTIDGMSSEKSALVGTTLATKNNLSVGSTFTAYGQTITVKGIYKTGSVFADNGVIMPLATVQELTDQAGSVTSATVTVNSSENVASTVSTLTTSLGTGADVTSGAANAATSLEPLESIENLTLAGVFGAAGAGAVIVLLTMIMIVRERRREIGVIKAIGGTNGKVVGQFVVESLTLTVVGAVLGIGIGILASGPLTSALVSSSSSTSSTAASARGKGGPGAFVSQAQSNIKQITATFSPQVFIASLGITFLIAIVGSAIPALLIARVRPAEVLRSE